MAMGEGLWLSPEGRIIEVPEHYRAILDDPALFGFSEAELERFRPWSPQNREQLIIEAIRRDWIRVRAYREIAINAWRLDDWTLARIREALKKLGAFPNDKVVLTEVSKRRTERVEAGFILGAEVEAWLSGIDEACGVCGGPLATLPCPLDPSLGDVRLNCERCDG